MQNEVGCRRNNCDFLHITHANGDVLKTAPKETRFKCKKIYPKDDYVIKHMIKNTELWFCLNCDAWIQDKSNVLTNDWTLFDKIGDLRRDI